MKIESSIGRKRAWLAAVTFSAVVSAALTAGAAVALNGQMDLRPLTPSDLKDYGLTNAQVASGLATVPIHQPVYLEADVNIAIPDSNIVGVTWALTSQPIGSTAALMASPLGANVPVYKPADRPAFKVAGANGRAVLTPDLNGQYTVTATISTTSSGTTNVSRTITAGTYMGINTCALCHSGGIIAPNKVIPWSQTLHATMFTRGINGLVSDHYSGSCIKCHTVGYNTDPLAVNGGFDDVAKGLGWTFPAVLSPTNWDAVPDALKNLANIQCENCHGPGSEHAYSLGDTNRISVTWNPGDCGQCHDSKTGHVKNAEWSVSGHAQRWGVASTGNTLGANRMACVRCHTAAGFAGYADNLGSTNTYATNLVYDAITCQTCHEPHDATNPHQLRVGPNYTLGDGTVVTNAGLGGFCMNCHHSRNGSAATQLVNYPLGLPTWQGGSSFGVHDSPQGDMLEGANAFTYGMTIPSAAHRSAVTNTCVGCHMQPVGTTDPAFLQAGGHTFSMTYQQVVGGVTNTVDKVDVCIQCHGQIPSFDVPRQDYNGDGVIEGVQTEVQHLLDQLSTLLPNSTYRADGNYVADGLVKTSISAKTNWPAKFLMAGYNWQFVNADGSKGVHNAPFAVGLLKASIGDLTGDANNDGLPDWWQIQYFGSTTNPLAAPNASPSGDGMPNWLKYALGLDPTVAGTTVPDGVVMGNITAMGETNTVHIYTAAEVVFDTEVGKTYQIQSISSLSGGWQNVGSPVAGTGSSISLFTPTRKNVQQYYRVYHTP